MERVNLVMEVDAHKQYEFEVTDVDGLLGATVKWKMAKSVKGSPLIEKISDDVTEIEISGKKFTVYINPSDNVKLAPHRYYHEARVTDADGFTRPVVCGEVIVVDTLTTGGG